MRAAGDADLNAAAETLRGWRARAERVPPFEFYAGLLDSEGMRTRMLKRLGPEAAEPIDEFLNKALAFDAGAPPTLLGFLGWLREGSPEIKRDMEQGRDEVRVMTVHGAKGLEAPIVFLPDTCSTRSGRRPGGLLRLESATRPSGLPPPFLWPVKGTSKVAAVQSARADAERAEAEERNRLLYVALTRARDRLYVSGFESAQGAPSPNCWYRLIRDGLNGELQEVAGRDGRPVWRIESEADGQAGCRQGRRGRCNGAHAACPIGRSGRRRRSRCSPCRSVPRAWRRWRPTRRASRRMRRAGATRSRRRSARWRWPTTAASCAAR